MPAQFGVATCNQTGRFKFSHNLFLSWSYLSALIDVLLPLALSTIRYLRSLLYFFLHVGFSVRSSLSFYLLCSLALLIIAAVKLLLFWSAKFLFQSVPPPLLSLSASWLDLQANPSITAKYPCPISMNSYASSVPVSFSPRINNRLMAVRHICDVLSLLVYSLLPVLARRSQFRYSPITWQCLSIPMSSIHSTFSMKPLHLAATLLDLLLVMIQLRATTALTTSSPVPCLWISSELKSNIFGIKYFRCCVLPCACCHCPCTAHVFTWLLLSPLWSLLLLLII
jgi:hypothetical protein